MKHKNRSLTNIKHRANVTPIELGVRSDMTAPEFHVACRSVDTEMAGVMKLGRYLGMDLNTGPRLVVEDFDRATRAVRWSSGGQISWVPVGPKLAAHLIELAKVAGPGRPLFPSLYRKTRNEIEDLFAISMSKRPVTGNKHALGCRRRKCSFSSLFFKFVKKSISEVNL